jgi:hypothetical protein
MPLAHFPGDRNWGYDGVFPFAVHPAYGGVFGLMSLIDACHRQGLAVIIDVVYNHLGPEGNYLWGLGNYFTDRYQTPWGDAINYDAPHSDGVRDYFLANAHFWLGDLHADGLRLDAVHAIYGFSAYPILEELAHRTDHLLAHQRQVHLIAEGDRNDPRLVRDLPQGGYGLAAQWSDDFHHALHRILTGETNGYYSDYAAPGLEALAGAIARYVHHPADGKVKLLITYRALGVRRQWAEVFQKGEYLPLQVIGSLRQHVIAFARVYGGTMVIAVAPRWLTSVIKDHGVPLGDHTWHETRISLPSNEPMTFCDGIAGHRIGAEGVLWLRDVLAHAPVALLVGECSPTE